MNGAGWLITTLRLYAYFVTYLPHPLGCSDFLGRLNNRCAPDGTLQILHVNVFFLCSGTVLHRGQLVHDDCGVVVHFVTISVGRIIVVGGGGGGGSLYAFLHNNSKVCLVIIHSRATHSRPTVQALQELTFPAHGLAADGELGAGGCDEGVVGESEDGCAWEVAGVAKEEEGGEDCGRVLVGGEHAGGGHGQAPGAGTKN